MKDPTVRVNLTSEGLNLYNLVAPVIEKVENIGDEFLKMSGTLRESVKLVSFGAMLVNVLPKYLIGIWKEESNVRFSFLVLQVKILNPWFCPEQWISGLAYG